jgi:hypothetical protein
MMNFNKKAVSWAGLILAFMYIIIFTIEEISSNLDGVTSILRSLLIPIFLVVFFISHIIENKSKVEN